MNRKNVIIWGCGMLGGLTLERCTEQGYVVRAFYDADEKKQNTTYHNLPVLNQKELIQCVENNPDMEIVYGTVNLQYVKEMEASLKAMFPRITPNVITQAELAGKYLDIGRKEAKKVGIYKVEFQASVESWLSSITDEVEFWHHYASDPKVNLLNRQKERFYCKRVMNLIKADKTVFDVGCGIFSQYGDCLEYGKINLVQVDSLAAFYQRINEVFCKELRNKEIKFGMMELMSEFFHSSPDIILIDNALDHCIDPYKSILECLHLVKESGGCLSLRHRRAEGIVEYYTGLHNWNLDYNDEGDFIIWNQNNYMNVSAVLKDTVDIELFIEKGVEDNWEYLNINLYPSKAFELGNYTDRGLNRNYMAFIIKALMRLMASEMK